MGVYAFLYFKYIDMLQYFTVTIWLTPPPPFTHSAMTLKPCFSGLFCLSFLQRRPLVSGTIPSKGGIYGGVFDTAKFDAIKLSDGVGMYLLINPNGSKYWRYDYRYAGKRKTLALGWGIP